MRGSGLNEAGSHIVHTAVCIVSSTGVDETIACSQAFAYLLVRSITLCVCIVLRAVTAAFTSDVTRTASSKAHGQRKSKRILCWACRALRQALLSILTSSFGLAYNAHTHPSAQEGESLSPLVSDSPVVLEEVALTLSSCQGKGPGARGGTRSSQILERKPERNTTPRMKSVTSKGQSSKRDLADAIAMSVATNQSWKVQMESRKALTRNVCARGGLHL